MGVDIAPVFVGFSQLLYDPSVMNYTSISASLSVSCTKSTLTFSSPSCSVVEPPFITLSTTEFAILPINACSASALSPVDDDCSLWVVVLGALFFPFRDWPGFFIRSPQTILIKRVSKHSIFRYT